MRGGGVEEQVQYNWVFLNKILEVFSLCQGLYKTQHKMINKIRHGHHLHICDTHTHTHTSQIQIELSLLSVVSFFTVSVTHVEPWSENIK